MERMVKRLECSIHGRVQMVLFRDFAERKAKKLHITGTVKNEDDGTISIIAEGDEENLKEFLHYLRKGPVLSHVEKVEEVWKNPTGAFRFFSIIY